LRRQIEKELPEEDAVKAIQQAHSAVCKAQFTWFRREIGVHWLAGFGDDPQIAAAALAACEEIKK